MTNAIHSLKAATTEYVSQYGINQFISGQMTANDLATMYDQVDELNGLTINEAEQIIQGKLNEFISSIEDENKVAEFWENVSEHAEYSDDSALATVSIYLSGKTINTDFFIKNYVTKSAFGRLTGLDTWRLLLSRAKRVDVRHSDFDAYQEHITVCGTTFKVVTTSSPNGNEVSVNEI